MKIVIALGGNMISDAKNKTEAFDAQKSRIAQSAKIIANIIERGHDVIITHGNGPQVGSLLLQQLAHVEGSVGLPLNILGPLTQGQIGVLLQHALINEFIQRHITKDVVVIPATVIVDSQDPGFSDPSKPVGSYFDKTKLQQYQKDIPDFSFIKTDDGYRRVVASPLPTEILEYKLIDEVSKDNLVITVGGGGTPAVIDEGQLEMKDAVIDKDLASSLLAQTVHADLLLILTNVDGVYRNFKQHNQEFVEELTRQQACELIASDAASRGSMEPKIRAGINFSHGETIITSPDKALLALEGKAGTRITN